MRRSIRLPASGLARPGDRRRWWALAALTIALLALSSSANVGWGRAPDERDPPPGAQRLLAAGFPVYCGGAQGTAVALTFDDGPGPLTRAALDTLVERGVSATFFDVGRRMVRYRRLVRDQLTYGEVGNHSWSHPVLPSLSLPEIVAEIARPQLMLGMWSGGSPQWLFRPPYGAHDSRVDAVAKRFGLVTILWSVYTGDTAVTDPALITAYAEAGARPGSIILLHENNNHGPTVSALPGLLDILAAKGLRPVTLTELLTLDPPTDRQLRTGPYGCGPTVTGVNPAEGPGSGATAVTISGDWLNLPQSVYFGNHRATSVTAISRNEIHALAPSGSGTVDVTVTTHFDSSPTSTLDHYTYR